MIQSLLICALFYRLPEFSKVVQNKILQLLPGSPCSGTGAAQLPVKDVIHVFIDILI